jgi:hypothetical protein
MYELHNEALLPRPAFLQRLHARGPMELRELTTYKWVVVWDYHVRQ